MPKDTKHSWCEQHTIENVVLPEEISEQEETGTDQKQEDVDQEVFLQPQPLPSSAQVMPSIICHT